MNTLEQAPPHNPEAERAAIGAALLDRDIAQRMVNCLRPDDFYERDLQLVWLALTTLLHDDQPVDLITVHDWLRENHPEERPWGSLLTVCVSMCPTAANWFSYARLLARDCHRRAIVIAAQDIIERAHTLQDPYEILEPMIQVQAWVLHRHDEAKTW